MSARTQGTKDVSAVELRGWEQIQRGGEQANPRGASDRMQQQTAGGNSRMNERGEQMQDQRRPQHDAGVRGIVKTWNKLGVQDAENQRGHCDDKAHQRARRAHVKERASSPNRRANENESAQRSDQCRKGNKVGIARMNVVVTARKIVAQFVREQDRQQGERERQSAGERKRVAIQQRQCADEFVPGDRLILRIGRREVRPGHQAGAQRREKQTARQNQRLQRWMPRNNGVVSRRNRSAPILRLRRGEVAAIWNGVGHEVRKIATIWPDQYSTTSWFVQKGAQAT